MEGVVPEWNDFWKFVADVGGTRPKKGAIRRYKVDEPFGPKNYYWQEWVACSDKAQRMRDWRARNLIRAKGYEIKKRFGITLEQYDEMLEAQDGKCAICENEESVARENGAKFGLALDHCHKKGYLRGLLCMNCNRGLGHFGDSVERLESAIRYLRSAE